MKASLLAAKEADLLAAGTVKGITEVRRQETLLKAGALQSAIFNSANFSSIATDEKGVIQIFNVGAERMLGYAAADVMNKITPADISDPQEVIARAAALSVELATTITPGFEALVFKASRGIEDIYELTYIRKDGSRFPAVVSVTALRDERDGIIGYLLIGTDNTARKQVEAEQKKLDQRLRAERRRFELALQHKNVELENANLAKDRFLASMSHELRTPLNGVIGFTGTLLMGLPGPLNAEQREQLSTVDGSARLLLSLINDLLDLAKIESGKVDLRPERVDLRELVEEVMSTLRPTVVAKGLRLEGVLPSSGPVYLYTDRRAVMQVLLNLGGNAVKFTERGEVRVELSQADRALAPIEIAVTDTGIGIRQEDQAKLFTAFTRLEQAHGRPEGTGLGLHLSQKLAELLGGRITLESREGVGSTFTLILGDGAASR